MSTFDRIKSFSYLGGYILKYKKSKITLENFLLIPEETVLSLD